MLPSVPVTLVAIGAALLFAHWLPRFVSGREPAAAPLLIGAGGLLGLAVPSLGPAIDPVAHPVAWARLTEFALLVSLFGVGLRIDRKVGRRRLVATGRMLLVAMPAAIALTTVAGLWAGLSLGPALLLAAALAPTDPVLASDVQVGKPMEGGEHPVRLTLTAEAGLNDGLGFPFLRLALLVAAAGWSPASWGPEWLAVDLIGRVGIGVAVGWLFGWVLNRVVFRWPASNPLAETDAGVVAVAGVLIIYGLTELAHGYGFIAVFIAGLRVRHVGDTHRFHVTLHDFVETLERTLLAAVLLALGASLTVLFSSLSWELAAPGLVMLFVARPLTGYLSLVGTHLRPRHRAVVAVYGVRGLGAIYYLAWALAHAPDAFGDPRGLWAAVAFAILLSVLVLGLTAGIAVEKVTSEPLEAADVSLDRGERHAG